MALLSRLVPIVLAAAVAACSEPSEPAAVPAPHRAVYALVEVGSPIARLIGREIAVDATLKPLAGATVVVAGGGAYATLVSNAAAARSCFTLLDVDLPAWGIEGCYASALGTPVRPNTPYTLSVSLPDGSRIAGSLTTPAIPGASIPADSQRVTVEYRTSPDGLPIVIVPLVLESAASAARVEAFTSVRRGWTTDAQARPTPIDPTGCVTRDGMLPFRLVRLPDTKDFWVFSTTCRGASASWDSLDLDVHVVAADANYAGYANTVLSGLATPEASSGFGVTGAVGVFGALAERVLSLRLVFCGPKVRPANSPPRPCELERRP